MKKKIILAITLIALILPFSAIKAFDVKTDNSIKLNKEEVADGNIYASCGDMVIDGTVNGDIIALCKNITINGKVLGDVIAFADKIDINGVVYGNVRVAGSKININGEIDHNANIFASEMSFNKDSIIKWDALVAGVNGNFAGTVDGNLHGLMSMSTISGKIGRNVNLTVDDRNLAAQYNGLTIGKDAVIAGSVSYTATKDLKLENPSSVSGQINRQAPNQEKSNPLSILWLIFFKASSLILIAVVIISLKKTAIAEANKKIENNWWSNILIGLALLLLTPIAIIILMITLIGLPLALIILAAYLSSIILAMIFASSYLGDLVIKKISKKTLNPYLISIIGLLIFSSLSVIPFIGGLISIIVISIGLGSLFLNIKNK
jgi:cytoskeletal protein CcmA (bactofilin family)